MDLQRDPNLENYPDRERTTDGDGDRQTDTQTPQSERGSPVAIETRLCTYVIGNHACMCREVQQIIRVCIVKH